MSYATVTDFITRVDVRRLGDLAKDDGTRETAGGLTTNDRIQAALDDGAGMIDGALMRGRRYSPVNLDAIMDAAADTDPLWNSRSLLIRINVGLAYGLYRQSRGYLEPEPMSTEAQAYLSQLAQGEWIFTIDAVKDAGLPVPSVTLSKKITLITEAAGRYFGDLNNQG